MKLIMNAVTKEGFLRYDRESIRICPSKLSKRELEDLYFSLLDANVELKKTINTDQDRIKVLSARLQRMTVSQRHSVTQRGRDCCAGAQTVIDGQNDRIQDLERLNMHLTEKVKMLNLRVSSAKQFLRRSNPMSGRTLGRDTTRKSSSATLNTRKTDLCTPKTEAACQCSEVDLNISNETNINSNLSSKRLDVVPVKLCDENKCQSQMEEYKQTIANLQDELTTTHSDYSSKVSHLQHELSELQDKHTRVLGASAAADQTLADSNQRLMQAKDEARQAQAKCADLTAELSIERKKLAEMETQLKSLDRSQSISRTIEAQLNRIKSPSMSTPTKVMTMKLDTPSPVLPSKTSTSPAKCLNKSDEFHTSNDKQAPPSDDSGYNDPNKSEISNVYKSPGTATKVNGSRDINKGNGENVLNSDEKLIVTINQELMKKITELQKQLDSIKIPTAISNIDETKDNNVAYKSYNSDSDVKNEDEIDKKLKRDADDNLDENYEGERNNDDDQDPKIKNQEPKDAKDTFLHQKPAPSSMGSVSRKTNKIKKKLKHEFHIKPNTNNTKNGISSDISNSKNTKGTKISSDEKNSSFDNDSSVKSDIVEHPENLKEENINTFENTQDNEEKGISFNDSTNQKQNRDTKDIKSTNDIEKQNDKEKTLKKQSSEAYFIRMDSSDKHKTDTQKLKAVILKKDTEKVKSKISEENNRKENAQIELPKSKGLGARITNETVKSEQSGSKHTYTLKGPVNVKSSDTDVDTERDVSSMTDLPTERDTSIFSAPSPGEQRYYRHDSMTSPMSYDFTELSEGEIGAYRGRNLSAGEKPVDCYNIDNGNQVLLTSAERLEATLEAVSAELKRCTRLLLMKQKRSIH